MSVLSSSMHQAVLPTDHRQTPRCADTVGEMADEVLRMGRSGEARRLGRFITQLRSLAVATAWVLRGFSSNLAAGQ